MTHLPRSCRCALFLALLHGASSLSHAQTVSFRPELPGLERLGKVKPLRSTQVRGSYWGIQAGSFEDTVLEKASALGVKWTRLEASWPSIEKEPGKYDWSRTDVAFDATLRYGITPFVTLVGGNGLYAPVLHYDDPQQAEIYGERPAPPTNNERAMAAWLRFVEAAIARYKDKIRYWEVWNEPNHRAYWGAPPDAADYGRLLRETATIIKRIEPAAKVIGGATAGMNAPFVDSYLSAGTEHLIDIISYHQYEGEPEERILLMAKLRAVIDRHNPAIATWQGECGYPSASSTRDYRGVAPWGPYIQAKWLLRQAFSDVFLSRSEVSNYFLLYSGGNRNERQPRSSLSPAERTIGYYPVRPDGNSIGARARRVGVNEKSLLDSGSSVAKPAYYAYRTLCAVLDKTYTPLARETQVEVLDPGIFDGIGPSDDAFPSVPIVASFARPAGTALLAYWLPWHGQEYLPRLAKVRLQIRSTVFQAAVLIDPITGEVFRLPRPRANGGLTIFDNLPLADYPFLIAERSAIAIDEQ